MLHRRNVYAARKLISNAMTAPMASTSFILVVSSNEIMFSKPWAGGGPLKRLLLEWGYSSADGRSKQRSCSWDESLRSLF
jgi:hypothetical protein